MHVHVRYLQDPQPSGCTRANAPFQREIIVNNIFVDYDNFLAQLGVEQMKALTNENAYRKYIETR